MTFADIRATLKRAHDQYFAEQCTFADPRLSAHQKARTAAKTIQCKHDQHVAGFSTASAAASRKAAHRQRMAAKAALRADPTSRAVALEQINAPIIERRRMAFLQSLALDIAAKKADHRRRILPGGA